jgi:hypothetical protein
MGISSIINMDELVELFRLSLEVEEVLTQEATWEPLSIHLRTQDKAHKWALQVQQRLQQRRPQLMQSSLKWKGHQIRMEVESRFSLSKNKSKDLLNMKEEASKTSKKGH